MVASELLRLANRKPAANFRSLKHVVGKKVTNVKLHRFVAAIKSDVVMSLILICRLILFVAAPNHWSRMLFRMLHIRQGHLHENTDTFKPINSDVTHREQNEAVRHDSCADTTCRIKYTLGTKGKLELELFAEYAHMMGMRPDEEVVIKLMQCWNTVGIQQNQY